MRRAAGESVGELALLQKRATRTATVAAAPPPPEDDPQNTSTPRGGSETADSSLESLKSMDGGLSHVHGGVELIRISRHCYDAAARSLLLASLEDLIAFLASCEPFKARCQRKLCKFAQWSLPANLRVLVMARLQGWCNQCLMLPGAACRVLDASC